MNYQNYLSISFLLFNSILILVIINVHDLMILNIFNLWFLLWYNIRKTNKFTLLGCDWSYFIIIEVFILIIL